MTSLKACCENVPPNVRKDLLGRVLIYCPHCGFSVVGDTMEDAAAIWNDDGVQE